MRLTLTSGMYAGDTQVIPHDVDPAEVLSELAELDWDWKCDWAGATEEEKEAWSEVDLMCRVLRALLHGREVRCGDKVFRCENPRSRSALRGKTLEVEEFTRPLARVIVQDDETGLVIGASL